MSLSVTTVTQWYPPEPAAQPQWIVQALAERGLNVRVLTGVPNYPTGTVLPGYRSWRGGNEVVEGVRVARTPLYPSHDQSALKRMANYASWAFSSALLGQRALRNAEVSLVYSSPATAALPAMVAKRRFGTPYVLLVQDVWPDSIFASGFLPGAGGRIVERVAHWFVNRTYRGASEIAVISPGMIDLLVARGVPREKLTLVYNWVAEPPSVPSGSTLRRRLGIRTEDFVLLYAGNHGAAQGLEPVVRAFLGEGVPANCHLVLVGDGVAKRGLQEITEAAEAPRIHFLESVPHAEVAELVAGCDAQLVSLADQPLFAVTMPSKLQAILAAGKPALVVAPGDAAAVVSSAGAGVTAVPGDVSSIAAGVRRLAEMGPEVRQQMGESGRSLYLAEMAEQVGAKRLMRLLELAAGRRGEGKKR